MHWCLCCWFCCVLSPWRHTKHFKRFRFSHLFIYLLSSLRSNICFSIHCVCIRSRERARVHIHVRMIVCMCALCDWFVYKSLKIMIANFYYLISFHFQSTSTLIPFISFGVISFDHFTYRTIEDSSPHSNRFRQIFHCTNQL